MLLDRKTKICTSCASGNRLKFLPCQDHGLVIPPNFCGHEFTSVTFIQNGTGILCHDCGTLTEITNNEGKK